MAESESLDNPVLHVIVIGFHHKKGCQVEYAFPSLIAGNPVNSNEVPPEWKHLPSLAIPDGAHNYVQDTVFFHLPARGEKLETVYGVSCYRQIDATELRNRGAEVTRNSVQKSVCVLSRLPLYGLIQAKLELITHAYFDERDFTQVSLLEDTYKNLCACLRPDLLETSQVFLGMSSREMVQRFKHKLLILFKLMLLERRVLFFGSPVKPICTTMLSVLSLFPRLLEYGLQESASYSPTRQLSPTLKVRRLNSTSDEMNDFLEVHYTDTPSSTSIKHAERVEKTSTKVDIKLRGGSSSSSEGAPSINGGWSGPRRNKPSPGHPVQVTEGVMRVSEDNTAVVDNLPGIHRQSSRDSSGGQISPDVIDHPLSTRYLHASGGSTAAVDAASGERRDSDSKENKDRHNLERKLERTSATASPEHTTRSSSPGSVTGDSKTALKKDPLEFVTEITKVSSVQKHLQRLSSSSTGCGGADDLTPDEQELLGDDPDECGFSWQDDKKPLLEISADPETPDVFGNRPHTMTGCSETGDTTGTGEMPVFNEDGSSEGVTRCHNLDLEVDMFGRLDESTKGESTEVGWSGEVEGKAGTGGKAGRSTLRNKLSAAWSSGNKESNNEPLELTTLKPETPSSLNVDDYGFPMSVFTKGMLCHPYLSLQFYDLLQDVNVRGFAVGATNVLYKQKRHLLDAIVDVTGEGQIEVHNADLRRQVALTTADLRFADYLVKVTAAGGELYLDDTSWEGGDEWLRGQFRHYLLSLLAVSQTADEKCQEDFNLSYIAAWRTTHNYKLWNSTRHPGMADVSCEHPYHGQLSLGDMKLKISHSLSNTERGKKVNAAMASTGKVVLQTGKAVGGALTSAKSAVSSWFSSWRQPSTERTTPDSPTEDTFENLTQEEPDFTVEARSPHKVIECKDQDQTQEAADEVKDVSLSDTDAVKVDNVGESASVQEPTDTESSNQCIPATEDTQHAQLTNEPIDGLPLTQTEEPTVDKAIDLESVDTPGDNKNVDGLGEEILRS